MFRSRMIGLSVVFALAAPAVAQDGWLTDYNAAREMARSKNRPIILDFGTVNCFWCKKLEMTTFRDPAVAKRLAEQFVAVRIDADKEPALAQSLGVASYPTLVFAAPDGKILGKHLGYVEAPKFHQQLDRAIQESGAATKNTELAAAPTAPVSRPSPRPAMPTPAQPTLGRPIPAAVAPINSESTLSALAQLRLDYQAGRFVSVLERGKQLMAAGGTDAFEAQQMIDAIKSDPAKTRALQNALADTLGELLIGSAESAMRQGRFQDALMTLERTQQLCPGSPHALAAKNYDMKLRSHLAEQPVVRMQSP